ncbi:unnamed protein product, partial [Ixodes pacificus]
VAAYVSHRVTQHHQYFQSITSQYNINVAPADVVHSHLRRVIVRAICFGLVTRFNTLTNGCFSRANLKKCLRTKAVLGAARKGNVAERVSCLDLLRQESLGDKLFGIFEILRVSVQAINAYEAHHTLWYNVTLWKKQNE